ncbi:MAG: MFS transporter [Natronomonas sp.]|uniref:MFS transporter n=1 Tax=Natronomonas sp. TaxID=2184060 RepID=UPI00287051CC|nr:MFS transporter [Natronomonas sp.]MDR9430816.1 MFS transporter [Natronomonas sp.]
MSEFRSVGDVLNGIQHGSAQGKLLAATGAMWALAAMEVLLISFGLPTMTETWSLSGTAAGILGSASLGGMVLGSPIGSPIGGRLADRYGRVRPLRLMVALYAVSAGLTALATGVLSASGLRFLTGIGIGGTATATTVYLSEHLTDDRRDRYLMYVDAFWAIGSSASVVLAWLLLTPAMLPATPGPIDRWRYLFVFGA